MRLSHLGWLLLGIAACAAPKDENGDGIADGVSNVNSVTRVAPSTPVGTVSGLVMTTRMAPLADATVTFLLGNAGELRTTTTTADGAFSFSGVSAGGSGLLTITKTGFSTVRLTAGVQGNAGNVPINDANGNAGVVMLQELTSTLRFSVFTAQGAPAKKAKAQLEVAPAGFVASSFSTSATGIGSITFEATVDDLGALSFANVPSPLELARLSASAPSTNYTLVVNPLDEDEDGAIDFLGTVRTFPANELFTEVRRAVVLDEARTGRPLEVLASNVESLHIGASSTLRNTLRATDKILVLFNQPVLDASLTVRVALEDCVTPFAVTRTLTNQGTLLTITPGMPWAVGTKYNVAIRATPLDTTSAHATLAITGYAFGFDPNVPKALTVATFVGKKAAGATMNPMALAAGDALYVTFDTPLRATGTAARLFVTFDLNGNSTTGGAGDVGEQGGPFITGLPLTPAEPTSETGSTFTCATSGYASRWQVTLGALPLNPVPAGTAIKLVFARDVSATDGFQTIWGAPAIPMPAELGGSLVVAP